MITGEGRRPVRQKQNEFSLIEIGLNKIERQVANAAPIERCSEHRGNTVDDKLALDMNTQLFPTFLKLPRIQSAER